MKPAEVRHGYENAPDIEVRGVFESSGIGLGPGFRCRLTPLPGLLLPLLRRRLLAGRLLRFGGPVEAGFVGVGRLAAHEGRRYPRKGH